MQTCKSWHGGKVILCTEQQTATASICTSISSTATISQQNNYAPPNRRRNGASLREACKLVQYPPFPCFSFNYHPHCIVPSHASSFYLTNPSPPPISIGRNITHLIDPPKDPHCFRIQKDRVYYVRTAIANLATSVARANLCSLGTCFGKFTKTGKFKLHITALDHIAQHAKYKVWVKPNGEMPFLYGNHVLKAHIGRMGEDVPEHQGVVVYSMNDTPIVGYT